MMIYLKYADINKISAVIEKTEIDKLKIYYILRTKNDELPKLKNQKLF